MLKTLSMSEISRIFADANLTRLAKHYNIYEKGIISYIFNGGGFVAERLFNSKKGRLFSEY